MVYTCMAIRPDDYIDPRIPHILSVVGRNVL